MKYGICRGVYDGVLLCTDLEPDDILAIKALAPRLSNVKLFVLVGESNSTKITLAQNILDEYEITNYKVYQGVSSNGEYPKELLKAFDKNSQSNTCHTSKYMKSMTGGKASTSGIASPERLSPEQMTDEDRKLLESIEEAQKTFSRCDIEDFINECRSPFLILLKPPHELMNLNRHILSKSKAALYGSFNLKELKDKESFVYFANSV